MKKFFVATFVVLFSFLFGVNAASAQTTDYASGVDSYTPGNQKDGDPIDPSRDDATDALGAPDSSFVSLGYGGELVLEFPVLMSGSLSVAVQEVTGGSYPLELADVEVSLNGSTWTSVGQASNEEGAGDGLTEIDVDGIRCFQYVRITDATDSSLHNNNSDGFDVDAVSATYDAECELEPEPRKPIHIDVENSNAGHVGNIVVATANTGGNSADGSYGGHGGRGGDIDNSGEDVDDSSTGNGGAGGHAGAGGYVETGNATAEAGTINVVNSNTTRINRCECDDSQEGHITVVNSNRAHVGNMLLSGANTGDNSAGGSYAGNGGRGGDIDNRGDDVDESGTGSGGIGGNGRVGGSVFSGNATSLALVMNTVNRNNTRIQR